MQIEVTCEFVCDLEPAALTRSPALVDKSD